MEGGKARDKMNTPTKTQKKRRLQPGEATQCCTVFPRKTNGELAEMLGEKGAKLNRHNKQKIKNVERNGSWSQLDISIKKSVNMSDEKSLLT